MTDNLLLPTPSETKEGFLHIERDVSLWNQIKHEKFKVNDLIKEESKDYLQNISDAEDSLTDVKKKPGDPVTYMENILIPNIKPLLENTLKRAIREGFMNNGKSEIFKLANCLTESLWNRDGLCAGSSYTPLLETSLGKQCQPNRPKPKKSLDCLCQRNIYTQEEAAVMIQKKVRGWLVRREPQVEQLRQFWKALKSEKNLTEEEIPVEAELKRTASFEIIETKIPFY